MNYLGHAWLSFGDPLVLAGNMIGDHVKGKKGLELYPERLALGIMTHRKIDDFVDRHPAVQRAKLLFRPEFGLYSGALMDVILDHFLANDPACFASRSDLESFSGRTYAQLSALRLHFPSTFADYFEAMVRQDWLSGYRRLDGVKRALRGLEYRAKHIPDTRGAFPIFISRYHELNQAYMELIGPLTDFVKIQLSP